MKHHMNAPALQSSSSLVPSSLTRRLVNGFRGCRLEERQRLLLVVLEGPFSNQDVLIFIKAAHCLMRRRQQAYGCFSRGLGEGRCCLTTIQMYEGRAAPFLARAITHAMIHLARHPNGPMARMLDGGRVFSFLPRSKADKVAPL